MHASPCQPLVLPQNTGVLIGVLDTEVQSIQRKDGQYFLVGKLQVLKLQVISLVLHFVLKQLAQARTHY